MTSAKEFFRKERQKKKISLSKVSEKTKIPFKYLEAIEAGDCSIFPNFRYAQLYVRDYANFLGIPPQKAVSFFSRDWEGELSSEKKEKKTFSYRLFPGSPFLTGGRIFVLVVILFIAGYLTRQYFVFNSPPPLAVKVSCLPGRILVEGKTKPDAIIRIEGKAVYLLEKGKFQKEIAYPWPEKVIIQAESPAGKIKEEVIPTQCQQ